MLTKIIFQSDWWVHALVGFILWGLLYLIEFKILKRDFKSKRVLAQLLLSNLIDLDHLFAATVYVTGRCSINYHALHSFFIFPIYLLGLLTKYRYFFLGIIAHLLVDYLGCVL